MLPLMADTARTSALRGYLWGLAEQRVRAPAGGPAPAPATLQGRLTQTYDEFQRLQRELRVSPSPTLVRLATGVFAQVRPALPRGVTMLGSQRRSVLCRACPAGPRKGPCK
jgi:hypothetical protein